MTSQDFYDMFFKLCVFYQTPNLDLILKETLPEYYKNSDESLTWLGALPKNEFGMILDELKAHKIIPEFGATIPRLHQLKEIYDREILPVKINSRLSNRKPICNICNSNGMVLIYHKITGVESAVMCICELGEKMDASLCNPKRRNGITETLSYRNIDWNTYSLAQSEYPGQEISSDPELKQILNSILEKSKKWSEERRY